MSAIIIQFYCALIILIDNIVMDLVYLFFQEVLGIYHLCQDIIHFGKIEASWSLSVQFLFSGFHIDPSGFHGHESTITTPHILVHRKFCIEISLYISIFVYWQDQW